MNTIPKMPEKYKGKLFKKNIYVKNTPRKWTPEGMEWCLNLEKQGYTYEQIAKSIDRDIISVSIKMKRLKKKDGRYNVVHVKEKYKIN